MHRRFAGCKRKNTAPTGAFAVRAEKTIAAVSDYGKDFTLRGEMFKIVI